MRRSWASLLLAFLALAVGSATGWLLFLDDPSWYDTLLPDELAGSRNLSSTPADLLSVIYSDDAQFLDELSAFSAYLFSHNTRIALFAFSLGVLVCVPSFALCAYQGLILGAFVALHVDRGVGDDLFGWLSVHGVTELSAIVVATAGGFRLGLAVLFPGRLSRRAALRREGRDAVLLAVLAALMLLVAGLLEGFARQLIQDLPVRGALGWGVGALWLAYLLLAGRAPRGREGHA